MRARRCGIHPNTVLDRRSWCGERVSQWARGLFPAFLAVMFSVTAFAAPEDVAPAVGDGSFRVTRLPSLLQGTWELFPGGERPTDGEQADGSVGVPIRVPGAWEHALGARYDGHAWYRVRFFLGQTDESVEPLGLGLPRVRDADEAFLNGVRIGAAGSFPPIFQTATLYPSVYPLPTAALVRGGWNTVLVHVYNHSGPGGMAGQAPVIGQYRELLGGLHRQTYVALAFAIFFLIVAVNHFFLFLHRPEEGSNGIFSLYGIASAVSVLTLSPFLLPRLMSLNMVFRLNLALKPVTGLLFTLFLFVFFQERPPAPVRWLLSLLGLGALSTMVWPRLQDLNVLVAAGEVAMVGLMGLIGWFLSRQIRRRSPYAVPVAVVVAVVFAASIYDIMAEMTILPAPSWSVAGTLVPIAFIPFYGVIGMILGHRYSKYYLDSTEDQLTGLLQRKEFMARLGVELERASREGSAVLVCMMDLDGFKSVNDRYGHAAGDSVLQVVGAIVRDCTRSFDLAGRVGGDEMALAIVVRDEIDGVSIMKRICSGVEDFEIKWGGQVLEVTASCGVAVWRPGVGETPTPALLLSEADRAMYQAKEEGGAQVRVIHPETTQSRRVSSVEV